MDWWRARISPPYYYLLVGVILFLAAVRRLPERRMDGTSAWSPAPRNRPTFGGESQYISLVVFAASDISCTG